jgi:hypothetical protein
MSSEDNYEIEIPPPLKEAMQTYISFLTANFAYDELEEIEFRTLRESILDGFFITGDEPVMARNNIPITGNDLFNAACILMTDLLYNATSGNNKDVQEVLRTVGLAVVNS